ncbi:CHAT domain-containing protein [Lentzea sp. NPDC006480]|uniref:CHAT domain-containing protein n=1 Tax=Lentzea sp. NPDC006480 TaxID=3157176 RepID=UPI0033A5592F
MDFWQDVLDLRGRIERSRSSGAAQEVYGDDVRALADRVAGGADTAAPDHRATARYLLGWVNFLWFANRPHELADPVHLARSIVYFTGLSCTESMLPLDLLPVLPGFRPEPAMQLGCVQSFLRRAEEGGDPALFEAVIVLCRSVVESDAPHPARLDAMAFLGLAHRRRYQHAEAPDQDDLRIALEAAHQVVAARDPRDPDRAVDLANVAVASRMRFELAGDETDLWLAVETGEAATETDHPLRDLMFPDLALTYWLAYRHTGHRDVLDMSITAAERALAALAGDRGVHLDMGVHLVFAYRARFEATSDRDDLVRSIEMGCGIAATSPEPALLDSIGRSCRELAGTRDLRQEAELAERVLAFLPAGHESRAPLTHRIHLTALTEAGSSAGLALDLTITWGERALASLPHDSMLLEPLHGSLSRAYRTRFLASAEQSDLDGEIAHGREALALAPPGSAEDVDDLIRAYRLRFELRGDPADLDRSIDAGHVASDSHPPHVLAELATSHRIRFLHRGLASDLEAALRFSARSFTTGPADQPGRGLLLLNAATVEHTAWQHDMVPARLERVAELGGQVLAEHAADLDDRARAAAMHTLAAVLHARASITRWIAPEDAGRDLVRATALCEQAASLVARDDHMWYRTVSLHSGVWEARFDLGGVPEDLRRAVALAESALSACSPSGSDWAQAVSNVAYVHLALSVIAIEDCTPEVLSALVGHWSALDRGQLRERVHAGFAIGALAHALGDHDTAVSVLDETVALLPVVAPALNRWHDNEFRLREFGGLAPEAVCAHLATGDVAGAVEIAEASRGVLLRSALTATADLAPRPSFAEVRSVVAGGAGVLLNVGRRRADAVIVTAEAEPVVVTLPELGSDEVDSRVLALLESIDDTRPLAGVLHRRRVLRETLDWLWTTAVEPVLAALTPPAGQEKLRVWWVPTGLLSLFPLHATCLDQVVSSYAPTFRTLTHLRGRPVAPARHQLTVALPNAPGAPALPGAVTEAERVGGRMLIDAEATGDTVRAAIADATWAHFACHAVSNLLAPSTGGLHLHDGVLTAAEIAGLRPRHAELAYLSACSTAGQGLVVNEAISLASVFHLAGFRHVVANLWPVEDAIAAETAQAFYDRLPEGPVADDAALTLHEVTRALREKYPDRPDHWAGLVHSGL